MRRRLLPAAGALASLLAGCTADPPTSTEFRIPILVQNANQPLNALNLATHTSGDEEVPPRDTPAQGQATFRLSADGLTMEYRLVVANIENVVASHIHIGVPGVNGPFIVFLFGNAPPGGGLVNGVLAAGSFTSANFINNLAGHPMSDLIAAIKAGNAYVNVHTNDGVDGTNTGPGDFPGGEIRGHLDTGHAAH